MLRGRKGLSGNEEGAAAVEYGLIAALIVIVAIAGLGQVATTTTDMWNRVADSINGT